MGTKTESQISELKINYLTEELYQEALNNGQINDDEFYMTPIEDLTLLDLGVTATAIELNKLSGIIVDANELNMLDGVTDNIQTQFDDVKAKLNSIDEGASKIIIDSALSSTSTNPVQNKIINEAISNLNALVGDTAVSAQIATAVGEITHPVTSVNGKAGAVQLTASDVGALPASTTIPSIAGLATDTYVDGKISSVNTSLNNKVDKVDGKGLSTNDYTTTEKNKLDGIAEGANKTIVDSALSSTSTNPVQNKVVNAAISNLNTLVGDTAVSEQITTALATKSNVVVVNVDGFAGTANMSGTEISEITQSKVIFAMVSGLGSKVYSYHNIQYSTNSEGTSRVAVFVATDVSETAVTTEYLYIDDSKNVTSETKAFSGGKQEILVVEIDSSTNTASHSSVEIWNANQAGTMVFMHDGDITMPLLYAVDPISGNVSVKFAEYNIIEGVLICKSYIVYDNKSVTTDMTYFGLASTIESWKFTLEDGSTVTKKVCIA